MTQNRLFSIIRFFEHISLVSFFGGVIYVVWFFVEGGEWLSDGVFIGVGVAIISFLLFLFTSMKVSKKIDLLNAKNDYAFNTEFLSLFERSPLPYVLINQSGKVTKINQSAIKLLRSPAEELIGVQLLHKLVKSTGADLSIMANKITSGITINDAEVAIGLPVGEPIWVLLSAYNIQHHNQILLTLVDVTQAKKIDIAKSEFLALATHQLRTPIAAISWNTELLNNRMVKEANEVAIKYIEKIQNNTTRMSDLIDDFLNVSKLELGTFATDSSAINFTLFLNNVIDEFGQKLSKKNIRLERTEEPADFIITTDERLLHIIISNLVSNAVKYVNESGTVWIQTKAIENKLSIRIADDGIGIPAKEVKKLFTKFYRASNASKHQAEGTGLGLYVVKQAVELLGGTITLETDSEKGAEFVIELPVR